MGGGIAQSLRFKRKQSLDKLICGITDKRKIQLPNGKWNSEGENFLSVSIWAPSLDVELRVAFFWPRRSVDLADRVQSNQKSKGRIEFAIKKREKREEKNYMQSKKIQDNNNK